MTQSRNHPITQHGTLLLADISGYTSYLAGVELEHAHDIVRELLEFIVAQLRPALTLAQIEGDAVLAYTPDTQLTRGETLLEIIESTYVTFKNHLTSVSRRHTCACAACRNISGLDLKFIVHHGEYISHVIHDQPELLGLAPMFVRERGWKTAVADATGWRGYALFTEASLAQLRLPPEGLQAITLDGMQAYGLNLPARYDEWMAARHAFIEPTAADLTLTRDFLASPTVLWDWLNDPEKRTRWMAGRTWRAGQRVLGRTGIGAQNHCDHRAGALTETVRDWRPFDYFTTEYVAFGGRFSMLTTFQLEPGAADKTRLHVRIQFPAPASKWLARALFRRILQSDYQRLNDLLAASAPPEPSEDYRVK